MKHPFVPEADDCHVRTALADGGCGQPFAVQTEAALCRLAVSMVISQHLSPTLWLLPAHTERGRAPGTRQTTAGSL